MSRVYCVSGVGTAIEDFLFDKDYYRGLSKSIHLLRTRNLCDLLQNGALRPKDVAARISNRNPGSGQYTPNRFRWSLFPPFSFPSDSGIPPWDQSCRFRAQKNEELPD